MLFAGSLTEEEHLTLIEAYKNHDVDPVRTRSHIIQLSAEGYQVKEIRQTSRKNPKNNQATRRNIN